MNRRLLRSLRFARRKSRGIVPAVRKAVAAGLSVALVVAPALWGFFPGSAEAKARPAVPEALASGRTLKARNT